MISTLKYSSSELFTIAESVINTIHNKVDGKTWNTINKLGIYAIKKTRRGCRAGKNKQRPISSIITNRMPNHHCQTSTPCANRNNLVAIPINHNQQNNLINVDLQKQTERNNKNHVKTKMASWNTRSMNNKVTVLCDFIIQDELDILAVQETWLSGDERDDCTLADISQTLPNFDFVQSPRLSSKGGGVCLLAKKGFKVSSNRTSDFSSFEYMDVNISRGSSTVRVFNIYRPPPSKKNKLTQCF